MQQELSITSEYFWFVFAWNHKLQTKSYRELPELISLFHSASGILRLAAWEFL